MRLSIQQANRPLTALYTDNLRFLAVT